MEMRQIAGGSLLFWGMTLSLAGCGSPKPPATSNSEPAVAAVPAAPGSNSPTAASSAEATVPETSDPRTSESEPTLPKTDNPSNTADQATAGSEAMTLEKTSFGKTEDGTEVFLFSCKNSQGVVVKLTNLGATVVAVEIPDRNGQIANVNLGFNDAASYEKHSAYFGCTVGRYGNRIAKGRFVLDEKEYTLATNNGGNHLHGGEKGFNRKIWKADEVKTPNAVGVKFSYRSPDGEEGYPGNLDVTATYTLTNDNELRIEYSAVTDKPTVLNLTNHCYWNLGGAGSGDIKSHELQLESDKYLAVDDGLIPTGEETPVEGTPLDFRKPHAIGERINEIKADPVGYDHCFVLRDSSNKLKLAARVKDPKSGRVMEVRTTEPGIQFYSGNFLNGDAANGGHAQHTAFCLETQHFPDSPNQPKFPSTVLKPGEKFQSTTVHKFLVDR